MHGHQISIAGTFVQNHGAPYLGFPGACEWFFYPLIGKQ